MLIMKRLTILFAAIAMTIGGSYLWTRPTVLTIAVGPTGSEQDRFVARLASTLAASGEPVRLQPVSVDGTIAASGQLDAGTVQLAVARSDDLTSHEARSVAILQRRTAIVIARAEKAATLAELKGKSILLVEGQGDTNLPLAGRILSHFGLVGDETLLRELPLDEAIPAFLRGEADAVFFVAPAAGRNIRDLVMHMTRAGEALNFIELTGAAGLVARFPYLEAATIPAGVFGGIPPLPADDMASVSITYELVASARLNDMTVSALTKSLLGARLRNTSNAGSQFAIEAPPTDEPRRFMPHAGTAAYLNNETKTLLETYSDHIWLALFGISILGSSVTGLLVWAGLRQPAESRDAFQHLPALVERIGAAADAREIEAIQLEFDRITEMSVLDYARGRLDEDDEMRAAWLTQVQRLIDRRREVLEAHTS